MLVERQLVRWRKELRYGQTAGELKQHIAVVIVRRGTTRGVEEAVAGEHVQIVARICSRGAASHPDAAALLVRRRIENRNLGERGAVIGVAHHPAVPRDRILVGTPPDINSAIDESQTRALVLLL